MVAASGFEYDRVRVSRVDNKIISEINTVFGKSVKSGRPSIYSKVKAVLNVLYKSESNRTKSPAKLLSLFRAEFEKQFPISEWEIATPSERSLRNYVKRYRQELAESGSNNFAS